MATARRSFGWLVTLTAIFVVGVSLLGCDDDSPDGDADADGDADLDGDADSDGDADADGEGDSDIDSERGDAGDADTDGDAFTPPELTRLSADELQTLLEAQEIPLINVHVPYAGEIPGTDTHIAYNDIDALADYIGADLDTLFVLYCLSGPMSFSAGDALVDRGYTRAYDLRGGMNAWRAAGYELNE